MMNIIFSILISVFSLTAQGDYGKLPNIDVTSFAGEKIKLESVTVTDHLKIVSLWATWCSPCKQELNAVSEVYDEWKEKYNVEIIAISLDNARGLKRAIKYAGQQKWGFTMLHDTNAKLMGALKLQAIPYSMLVDAQGNILSVTEGYYEGYEADMTKKIEKYMDK